MSQNVYPCCISVLLLQFLEVRTGRQSLEQLVTCRVTHKVLGQPEEDTHTHRYTHTHTQSTVCILKEMTLLPLEVGDQLEPGGPT